ncbi:MAG: GxxExxY protein [Planctomycetota bacterium]
MTENEIATLVVDAAYQIHVRIGPGLLESVYQEVMVRELRKRGLNVDAKVPVSIVWDSIELKKAYEADLIVERKVIVELKSVEELHRVHKKQLLTYLRLADMRLGLLINFGEALIKDGISRIANNLREQ